MFETLDKNGDGGIDIGELTGGIKSDCGIDLTDDEIRQFHLDCDNNGDGMISLEEFSDAVAKAYAGQKDVQDKLKASEDKKKEAEDKRKEAEAAAAAKLAQEAESESESEDDVSDDEPEVEEVEEAVEMVEVPISIKLQGLTASDFGDTEKADFRVILADAVKLSVEDIPTVDATDDGSDAVLKFTVRAPRVVDSNESADQRTRGAQDLFSRIVSLLTKSIKSGQLGKKIAAMKAFKKKKVQLDKDTFVPPKTFKVTKAKRVVKKKQKLSRAERRQKRKEKKEKRSMEAKEAKLEAKKAKEVNNGRFIKRYYVQPNLCTSKRSSSQCLRSSSCICIPA
jgi:hypothetical protein